MMIKLKAISFLKLFFILSVFTFINGCEAVWPFYSIDEIPANNSRNLKIGLVKNPLITLKNSTGYEHDIVRRFADDLGYKVQWTFYKSPTDILKDIEKNKIDIGLGRFDSLLSIHHNVLEGPAYMEPYFYPRLFTNSQKTEPLDNKYSVSFLISKTRPEVQTLLNNWNRKAHRKRIIENIRDQYLSHLSTLDDFERFQFFRDIQFQQKNLFPKFKKIAREFNLPWQLVAAVAYQESHWDNEATSFTGVKGIMMLTQETANYLGVKDRENLEQSLWGGTKYLRMLMQMQPKHLTFRSKLILALASYNIGVAHLKDAQKIAYDEGYNPFAWHDLKLVLPRLSDSSYFKQLEYGYARGQEPIDFVNHVLNYFEILSIDKQL